MIELRIGGGLLTLRLWPTIIAAGMFVTLLGLGTWQVQRLQWKTELLATIEARSQEEPIDVSEIKDINQVDYRPAQASGLFQYDREFYLHAISLEGEGGYHVLTPLQLENGKYLLVDRGWVPFDKKLPATRLDGQLIGSVLVKGILRIPRSYWMQPANSSSKNDWYSIDLTAMAKMADIPEFMPFVLDADSTKNAGGYPLGGQTRKVLPNNHLSYAITWYGLALALLVIYGISSYRKVS